MTSLSPLHRPAATSCRPAPASFLTILVALTWILTALALTVSLAASTPAEGPGAGALIGAATMLAIGGPLTLALRDRDRLTQAVHLAGTDELTSLANRRNVVGGLGRALTTDRPLALMILDLDGFKHVNDTYGHPAGDLVLQVVAARLRASLGSDHLVARLGGDEFAVQVPEDDPAVLLQRAHAIRATLGRPIDIGPATVSIGVSIGITIRNPSHATPTDLLREADRAMYQAKLGAGATLHL